eukprot:3794255-Amphidinium_carterae.4
MMLWLHAHCVQPSRFASQTKTLLLNYLQHDDVLPRNVDGPGPKLVKAPVWWNNSWNGEHASRKKGRPLGGIYTLRETSEKHV